MKAVALIPAAGTGERFGGDVPKPLVKLNGKPVIAHTLAVFERIADVTEIILIVHPGFLEDYQALVKSNRFSKVRVVKVGATRTQSVRNGLQAVTGPVDCVIIHDGVRPLVSEEMVRRGLQLVVSENAVIAAVPVKPTLKVVEPKTNIVRETLDRALVWEIQTPQIFERKLLERAYADDVEATDDAALIERLGVPVKVFMGDYRNIKITTPEDLIVAEALMRK